MEGCGGSNGWKYEPVERGGPELSAGRGFRSCQSLLIFAGFSLFLALIGLFEGLQVCV